MSKIRKINNPIIKEILEEMENDPWYVKLARWYRLQKWVLICKSRKYWDKSFSGYIFKK